MNATMRSTLIVFFLCAGCALGPEPTPPATKAPEDWKNAPTLISEAQNTAVEIEWWKGFGDLQLNTLIAQAFEHNLSIEMARSRIREARHQRRFTQSDFFPTIDGFVRYTKSRISQNTDNFFPDIPAVSENYEAGFDATWELDIWGQTRRATQAAGYEYTAVENDARGLVLATAAEIARTYLDLRAVQAEILVTEQAIDSQSQTFSLTEERYSAGLGSELDNERARAQLAETRATLPTLQNRERQLMHLLAILLAKEPTSLYQELVPTPDTALTPPTVPAGLPSELLRRRPDLRAAEARLMSQTAQVGVATAEFFPSISLRGTYGTAFGEKGNFFDSGSRAWNFSPELVLPIFRGGSAFANLGIYEEREKQAVLEYQDTVLRAFQEVEDSLSALAHERTRRIDLANSVDANERAVALSKELYGEGLVDFLNVLETERALFEAQRALARSMGDEQTQLVALYKALGGGWQTELPDANEESVPTLTSEVTKDKSS
jgi:multidrug efflux system outer membrane protein